MIHRAEDVLIKSEAFKLPTKNRLSTQKKQQHYYSGKKKRHTLKSQIGINVKGYKILATSFLEGKNHDFKIFEQSRLLLHDKVIVNVDTGYLGNSR